MPPHTCRPQWMGAAVRLTNDLVSGVQGQKATAGGRATAALAAGGKGGSKAKAGKRQNEKKRR